MKLPTAFLSTFGLFLAFSPTACFANDPIADMQANASKTNEASWAHWGINESKYSSWKTHSNRLTPIYTFGIKVDSVAGENSVYRHAAQLKKLYGRLPANTLNPNATYFDQTDVYRLQKQAIEQGKKRIVLMVFDGMDWQTTRAAAIYNSGEIGYSSGRGHGLTFLDYKNVETDFGFFVTSPHNDGTSINVDDQIVTKVNGRTPGGYDPTRGGATPWAKIPSPLYPIGKDEASKHAYTDSAASATSMTTGFKTYNGSINCDFSGRELLPIARQLQAEGYAVGVATSVPVSHATPACAYANNVNRNDYQDITRDMLGLSSAYHAGGLQGLDVLLGAGWGENKEKDGGQGKNFVSGNRYLTNQDLSEIAIQNGGMYAVAQRTPGQRAKTVLSTALNLVQTNPQTRLFGFFGVEGGHLPYRTANGDFSPAPSPGAAAETYSEADLTENPTLAELTVTALEALQAKSDRWWLMIEAGDVDWANHANNIDNSIGAVLSGDEAFQALTEWIEKNGGWDDTAVILTADHGHYLVLDRPQELAEAGSNAHAGGGK